MARHRSRLKKEVIEKVLTSEILIDRLKDATGVSYHTIKYRWLEKNVEQLTLPICTNLIKDFFKISKATDITEVYKPVKSVKRKKIAA